MPNNQSIKETLEKALQTINDAPYDTSTYPAPKPGSMSLMMWLISRNWLDDKEQLHDKPYETIYNLYDKIHQIVGDALRKQSTADYVDNPRMAPDVDDITEDIMNAFNEYQEANKVQS